PPGPLVPPSPTRRSSDLVPGSQFCKRIAQRIAGSILRTLERFPSPNAFTGSIFYLSGPWFHPYSPPTSRLKISPGAHSAKTSKGDRKSTRLNSRHHSISY